MADISDDRLRRFGDDIDEFQFAEIVPPEEKPEEEGKQEGDGRQ